MKKTFQQPLRLFLVSTLCASALLQGCASAKLANQAALTAAADAKASEFGDNSELALQRAESAHETAVNEQLNFYAPHTMEKLAEALNEAQKAHDNQQTAQAVKAAASVLTLLENGQRNKAEAQKLLAPVFEHKQRVDEIKGQTVLPSDYQSVLDDIQDLIGYIEEGKSDQAVAESEDVIDDLKTLERNTMLTVHWQPAVDVLDQAEDEDADDHASQTYADAEQKVETAQEFISVNFSNRVESQKLGLEALRASQRALFIGRESQALQKLDAEKAEQAALKEEERLRQIGIAVGVSDLRYMALTDQSNAIIEHIQTSRREHPKTDTKTNTTPDTNPDYQLDEQLDVPLESQQQVAEETISETPATELQSSAIEPTEEAKIATTESVPHYQEQKLEQKQELKQELKQEQEEKQEPQQLAQEQEPKREPELALEKTETSTMQALPVAIAGANNENAIGENTAIEETISDEQSVKPVEAAPVVVAETNNENAIGENTDVEAGSSTDPVLVQPQMPDQKPEQSITEVSSEVVAQE